VFDVGMYLRHNDPPPEVQRSMEVCEDWRLGRLEPPAGLKNPRSEEHAREAYEVMKDGY
jgi:hypothetical protein